MKKFPRNYYDREFKPWEIADGQVIVVDEAEWNKLATVGVVSGEAFCATQETDADIGNNERPVVKVTTDIFDDKVKRPVVSMGGVHCFDLAGDSESVDGLLKRFLQTIDATPHVDYLLMTQRPELVRSKWQNNMPENVGTPEDADEMWLRHRSNVILAVPVETQADIERLVPELLKCHDLVKGLAVVCNPKEELDVAYFLDRVDYDRNDIDCDHENKEIVYEPGIKLIIAEGNEHPIHPDHVRSLRDQCLYTNVEFNFASWGVWAPRENCPNGLDDGKGLENLCHYEPHEGWVSGLTTAKNQHMVRVGKDKSGRLLDGVEHNGRIQ